MNKWERITVSAPRNRRWWTHRTSLEFQNAQLWALVSWRTGVGTPSRPLGISLDDLTAVKPDFELHCDISAVLAPRALCRHTGDGHFAPVKIFSLLTSWASKWPRAVADMPFLSPYHQPRVPALTGYFADPGQGNPLFEQICLFLLVERRVPRERVWWGRIRSRSWRSGLFSLDGFVGGEWRDGSCIYFVFWQAIIFRWCRIVILNKGRNSLTLPSFMQYLHISSRLVKKMKISRHSAKKRSTVQSGGFRSFWRVNIYHEGGNEQDPLLSPFLTGVGSRRWTKSIHLDRRWSSTRTNSWFAMTWSIRIRLALRLLEQQN